MYTVILVGETHSDYEHTMALREMLPDLVMSSIKTIAYEHAHKTNYTDIEEKEPLPERLAILRHAAKGVATQFSLPDPLKYPAKGRAEFNLLLPQILKTNIQLIPAIKRYGTIKAQFEATKFRYAAREAGLNVRGIDNFLPDASWQTYMNFAVKLERDKGMCRELKELCQEGHVLAVVGSGHVHNLQLLLQKQGIRCLAAASSTNAEKEMRSEGVTEVFRLDPTAHEATSLRTNLINLLTPMVRFTGLTGSPELNGTIATLIKLRSTRATVKKQDGTKIGINRNKLEPTTAIKLVPTSLFRHCQQALAAQQALAKLESL